MPAGGLVVTAIIGIVSTGAGIAQKAQANKIAKDNAQKQIAAEKQIAQANNQTQLTAGQNKNIADIIISGNASFDTLLGPVLSHEIDAQSASNVSAIDAAAAKKATILNKSGNLLLIIGGGVGAVWLTLFIIHKNKK